MIKLERYAADPEKVQVVAEYDDSVDIIRALLLSKINDEDLPESERQTAQAKLTDLEISQSLRVSAGDIAADDMFMDQPASFEMGSLKFILTQTDLVILNNFASGKFNINKVTPIDILSDPNRGDEYRTRIQQDGALIISQLAEI